MQGTPAAGKVSAADLIALAGAQAVQMTGGPDIDVPIGKVAFRLLRIFTYAMIRECCRQDRLKTPSRCMYTVALGDLS